MRGDEWIEWITIGADDGEKGGADEAAAKTVCWWETPNIETPPNLGGAESASLLSLT